LAEKKREVGGGPRSAKEKWELVGGPRLAKEKWEAVGWPKLARERNVDAGERRAELEVNEPQSGEWVSEAKKRGARVGWMGHFVGPSCENDRL
jgi:hypothetical protein